MLIIILRELFNSTLCVLTFMINCFFKMYYRNLLVSTSGFSSWISSCPFSFVARQREDHPGRSCVSRCRRRRNCGCRSLGRGHPSRSQFSRRIEYAVYRWHYSIGDAFVKRPSQPSPSKKNESRSLEKINKRIVTLMESLSSRLLLPFQPRWRTIFVLTTRSPFCYISHSLCDAHNAINAPALI